MGWAHNEEYVPPTSNITEARRVDRFEQRQVAKLMPRRTQSMRSKNCSGEKLTMENVNINSPVHGTELYSPTIVKLPPPPAAASSQATPSGEASQERTNNTSTTTPVRPTPTKLPDPHLSSPRLSSPWDPDALSNHCSSCRSQFDHLFKRRHHCRLCGRLFCHECSNTRSLIPPSALVLKAESGNNNSNVSGTMPSFADKSGNDDTSMTFV
eukprot:scaffold40885_cov155-Skeletonema_dohrnii-CCMP3373.AAC.5